MENMHPAYAGFWKRFLAAIIDGFILSVAMTIVSVPVYIILGIGAISASNANFDSDFQSLENNPDMAVYIAGMMFLIVVILLISVIIYWLYFAFMESSSNQATIGKMALGIKVTDLNGQKVSFGKATARNLSKYISGAIFYIGYIMAAFTEKKQALHDMIAGTLVVEK